MRIHRLFLSVALVCGVSSISIPIAKSTSVPDFSYYYTCSSGVVDCSNFPGHHSGGYASNGLPIDGFNPSLDPFNPGGTLVPAFTNILGEAIGYVDCPPFYYGGPVTAYGDASRQAHCIDACGEPIFAVDINDNGLYLFNGFGALIGSGGGLQSLSGFGPFLEFIGLGINNSNQVLALGFLYSGGTEEIVLSPTPAPESSSLILFCTALFGLMTLSYFKGRSL